MEEFFEAIDNFLKQIVKRSEHNLLQWVTLVVMGLTSEVESSIWQTGSGYIKKEWNQVSRESLISLAEWLIFKMV